MADNQPRNDNVDDDIRADLMRTRRREVARDDRSQRPAHHRQPDAHLLPIEPAQVPFRRHDRQDAKHRHFPMGDHFAGFTGLGLGFDGLACRWLPGLMLGESSGKRIGSILPTQKTNEHVGNNHRSTNAANEHAG